MLRRSMYECVLCWIDETHQSEAVGCGQHCCIHGRCVIGYTDPPAFCFVLSVHSAHGEGREGKLTGPGVGAEEIRGEEGQLEETGRDRGRERGQE